MTPASRSVARAFSDREITVDNFAGGGGASEGIQLVDLVRKDPGHWR
jgi:hypothetical protein